MRNLNSFVWIALLGGATGILIEDRSRADPNEVSVKAERRLEGSWKSQKKASRDRADAAVAMHDSAQANIAAAQLEVKRLNLNVEMEKMKMDGEIKKAKDQASTAEEYGKMTMAILDKATKEVSEAPEKAKKLVQKEIRRDLAKLYEHLEPWRKTYLGGPGIKSKAAQKAAAKPFNDAIRGLYGRLGEYTLNADINAGAAASAQSGAQDMASGAQGKMDSGDVIGASLDWQKAQAMAMHAAKLKGTAETLHSQAKGINDLVPQYIASGYQAAWRAAYETDPQFVPPPPYNPNYAFTNPELRP